LYDKAAVLGDMIKEILYGFFLDILSDFASVRVREKF
jgi:hypothetical protein